MKGLLLGRSWPTRLLLSLMGVRAQTPGAPTPGAPPTVHRPRVHRPTVTPTPVPVPDPTAHWISGGLVASSAASAAVCATANGCTDGNAFLACADPAQLITNITFAAAGDPTQCP